MTFSVVIPVYNVKDYLVECIESILKQTYKASEIILIDDGSNDDSGQICDDFSTKYDNIVVVHKENGGQSMARNKGVELITSEYFIFVDSDDCIAVNTLEMFKNAIDKNGSLDVVLSECMFNIEPDGKIVDVQRHFVSADFDGIDGKQAIKKMGMEWSPCGKCYRTEYWKKHGFRFLEGRISEDFQLIDRVTLEAERVAMIPGHYYYRWKIPSSTMHVNYGKLVKDTIFAIEDWDNYLVTKAFDCGVETIIRKRLAVMLEHIVMGNVYYADKPLIGDLIKDIERNYELIKYDDSLEGKLVMLLIKTFGVQKTCFVLNKIKAIRKKRLKFA